MFEVRQKTEITLRPKLLCWRVQDPEKLSDPNCPANKGFVRHDVKEAIDWVKTIEPSPKRSYTYHLQEYLRSVGDEHGKQPRAVAIWGTRNVFQNLGIVGYSSKYTPLLLYRADEPIHTWIYQGLVKFQDGTLSIEAFRCHPDRASHEKIEILGENHGREAQVEFIVGGQPLLWDGRVVPQEILAAVTYDLRHIFHVLWEEWTRKRFPQYDWHKEAHDELMDIFMSSLTESVEDRAEKICAAARRWGLAYERGYLMSAIGLRQDGTLVLVKQHGLMSTLGDALKNAGCRRGILNHQGGSVGLCYWSKREWKKNGWDPQGNGVQPYHLGQGTYFRPQGHAVLIAEFENDAVEPPFRSETTVFAPWGSTRDK